VGPDERGLRDRYLRCGKSTVAAELRARSYIAYDVDEDGFESWYRRIPVLEHEGSGPGSTPTGPGRGCTG
jgi:hypothetical protein